jgi:ubiquinone/menaquinone biosynthesis C-methylase UbiE
MVEKPLGNVSEAYDSLADDYDSKIIRGSIFFRHLYCELNELFNTCACHGHKALDIGCGTGYYSLRLLKMGFDVVGLDISSKSIKLAKLKTESRGFRQIDFNRADATVLPFNENSFDVIVAMGSVLNHVSAPERMIKEISRVLRPGGLFFTDVDNFTCLDTVYNFINPNARGCISKRSAILKGLLSGLRRGMTVVWDLGGKPLRIRLFTFSEIQTLMAKSRLAVDKVYGVHIATLVIPSFVQAQSDSRMLECAVTVLGKIDKFLRARIPFNFFGVSLVLLGHKSSAD